MCPLPDPHGRGLSHQALRTQHLLPPPWALAVPSAGLVQSMVLAWPSGALAPRPALSLASEQAVPFPGYRTRQLQDSSRVLSSPVVPGFPCCS